MRTHSVIGTAGMIGAALAVLYWTGAPLWQVLYVTGAGAALLVAQVLAELDYRRAARERERRPQ